MNGKYNFKITAQEGNLRFIEVRINKEILEFGGDFILEDDVLISILMEILPIGSD